MSEITKIIKPKSSFLKKILVSFIVSSLFSLAVQVTFPYWSSEIIDIQVTSKKNIKTVDGIKYIIRASGEAFENTNSVAWLKFDPYEVQEHLVVGQKYKVRVCGWAIPLLSQYRNIISIE